MGLFGGIGKALGGLFGPGFGDRAAISQAYLAGDYAGAANIRARKQQMDLAREEAEMKAQAEQARRAALKAEGFTDSQIDGMRPEDASQIIRESLIKRQFGPGGGSIYNPRAPDGQQWTNAPSRHQIGRSVVDVDPQGNNRTVFEGIEPVAVPDGGQVYGFTNRGPVAPGQLPSPIPGLQQGGDGLPRPSSAAERDALPPGTRYIAPDGSVKIKGGPSRSGSGGFPGFPGQF